ncbi:MAG: hypothetical protein MMC33_010451 [Icmadophila ericetorum]|nr:hypothetical protein [Icmadophila ericetorum]
MTAPTTLSTSTISSTTATNLPSAPTQTFITGPGSTTIISGSSNGTGGYTLVSSSGTWSTGRTIGLSVGFGLAVIFFIGLLIFFLRRRRQNQVQVVRVSKPQQWEQMGGGYNAFGSGQNVSQVQPQGPMPAYR